MNEQSPRRGIGWPATFLLLGIAVLALAAAIFFTIDRRITNTSDHVADIADKIAGAFAGLTNVTPVIEVNETVFFQKDEPALELAVVSRVETVERETTNRFLQSTKRYRVRGIYNLKAGFDLTEPVRVDAPADGGPIVITLPEAKILSVEQTKLERLEFDHGLWNRISAEEILETANQMQEQARRHGEKSNLREEAAAILKEHLETRLDRPVIIRTPTGDPPMRAADTRN